MDDLLQNLRSLGNREHDDFSVASRAYQEIVALRAQNCQLRSAANQTLSTLAARGQKLPSHTYQENLVAALVALETAVNNHELESCCECSKLEKEIQVLQQLRPLWAQGHSSDSIQAQTLAAALSQVWGMLGVDNQTRAMQKLQEWQDTIEDAYFEGWWDCSENQENCTVETGWSLSQSRQKTKSGVFSNEQTSTPFSEFIQHAPEPEKQKIYGEIMDAVAQEQDLTVLRARVAELEAEKKLQEALAESCENALQEREEAIAEQEEQRDE